MNSISRTPSPSPARLIHLGLWALPLSSVLKLVGNLGTFDSVGYGISESHAVVTLSGPGFFIGEFVGSILPVVLGIFGIFALFAYLFNTPAGRWATLGMMLSITGSALVLPPLGVINYAFPALAQASLGGDPGAFTIVNNFFRFPMVLVLFPGLLVPLGAMFFSIGIWKSRRLSRWAGVLFVVSVLGLSLPFPIHLVRLIGGALGVIAGVWITLSALRQSSSQAETELPLSSDQKP